MIWQKILWRTYKTLARLALTTPVVKLPLGNQKLRQGLDKMVRRFFCTILRNPMQAYGHVIYWDYKSYWYAMEYALQTYEPDTVTLFQKLIHPGMTVVDLGAHIGLYSLLAANLTGPDGRVYSFEPMPSNYALLLKNITANGYENIIKAVNKAVSDKSGLAFLFFNKRDESSLYAVSRTRGGILIVETITLDDFFEGEGWPKIDLIKMDIEGAEIAALKGAKQLIERNPDLKLIVEFAPNLQAAAGVTNEEFFKTLLELGFKKFWALRNGLQQINIPESIPHLVQMAEDSYINLFCER